MRRSPAGDHRRDRAGLGAGARRIGGVLDVAAGEDAPVRRCAIAAPTLKRE